MSDVIREIPEGADLEDLLNSAAGTVQSIKPKLPPKPKVRDSDQDKESPIIEAEEPPPPPPEDLLGDEMKAQMILPSEREKALLKQRYGGFLRVVPLPYMREDGKIQTYVLRPLTRGNWKKHLEMAQKIVEGKPGLELSIEDVFQEKVVAFCVVWPAIDDSSLSEERAGLIPTLFGVVQQISLFLSPEVVANLSFNL
jgi:hypothetical protein